MTQPRWDVLRASWAEDDGALVDIYVPETSSDDWRVVVEAVMSRWPSSYAEDGDPVDMPGDPYEVFRRSDTRACLLQVALTPVINVNAHFFTSDEIEFHINPGELLDQTDLDALIAFVSTIGRTLHRAVYVGIEGVDPRPPEDLRYEPDSDRVIARD